MACRPVGNLLLKRHHALASAAIGSAQKVGHIVLAVRHRLGSTLNGCHAEPVYDEVKYS